MEHLDLIQTRNIQLQKECEKYNNFNSFTKVFWKIHKITSLYKFEILKHYKKKTLEGYLDKLSDDLNSFLGINLASVKKNKPYVYECKIIVIEIDPSIMKKNKLVPSIGIFVSSKNLETNKTKISKIVLVHCRNTDLQINSIGYSRIARDEDSEPFVLYNMAILNGEKDITKEVTKWIRFRFDSTISEITIPPIYIYSLMISWTTKNFYQVSKDRELEKKSKKSTNKKQSTRKTKPIKSKKNNTNSKKKIKDGCNYNDYSNQEYDSDDYEHYANRNSQSENLYDEEEVYQSDTEDNDETYSRYEKEDSEVTTESEDSTDSEYSEDSENPEDSDVSEDSEDSEDSETKPKYSSKQLEFVYSFDSIMGKIKKKEKITNVVNYIGNEEDKESKDESLQILTLKVPTKTIYEIFSHCSSKDPNFKFLGKTSKAYQIMRVLGDNFKKILGFSLDSLVFVQIVTSEASLNVYSKVKFFNNTFNNLKEISNYI